MKPKGQEKIVVSSLSIGFNCFLFNQKKVPFGVPNSYRLGYIMSILLCI